MLNPDEPLLPASGPDDLSGHAHRQLIGILGLALPPLVWLIAGLRPSEGLPQLLNSISSYYYSGAVVVFVGILAALAVFFFSYRGYDNEDQKRDRTAALVAGIAAVLVAFFPTDPPAGAQAPSWWTGRSGDIHILSAVVLFLTLCYFALFLFPKSKAGSGAALAPDKRSRNRIYYLCGGAMAMCIVWAGIAQFFFKAPIFWPEALALEFFAVSWLVKGRADRTAVAIGKRTRKLVARATGARPE